MVIVIRLPSLIVTIRPLSRVNIPIFLKGMYSCGIAFPFMIQSWGRDQRVNQTDHDIQVLTAMSAIVVQSHRKPIFYQG
jgi:hypothetical protein